MLLRPEVFLPLDFVTMAGTLSRCMITIARGAVQTIRRNPENKGQLQMQVGTPPPPPRWGLHRPLCCRSDGAWMCGPPRLTRNARTAHSPPRPPRVGGTPLPITPRGKSVHRGHVPL